jgi:hypothetical protein
MSCALAYATEVPKVPRFGRPRQDPFWVKPQRAAFMAALADGNAEATSAAELLDGD